MKGLKDFEQGSECMILQQEEMHLGTQRRFHEQESSFWIPFFWLKMNDDDDAFSDLSFDPFFDLILKWLKKFLR